MIWTKARQRHELGRHGRRALRSLARFVKDNEEELLAMMSERHDQGFEAYGDTMYRWDHAELRRNRLEEIADYGVYSVSGMARGWPT